MKKEDEEKRKKKKVGSSIRLLYLQFQLLRGLLHTADESMVSVFEDVVPERHNFSRPKLCALSDVLCLEIAELALFGVFDNFSIF